MPKRRPKRPAERILFTFDYTDVLPSGVTLEDATCTITVKRGTDGNPAAMLSGAPAVSDTRVVQFVVGGLAGVEYVIHCLADASGGRRHELCETLLVKHCL